MSGALISGGPAAPFSLTIRGSRLTHNLFVIHEQGRLGGNVSATPNEKYQLPYVLPESVSLETSADDIGGTLTFTVDEPITPSVGPWWQDEKLPDNAIVEYGQGTEVDPYNTGQTRLFVGFVESIDATPNAGGQGTTATVTCVSTNAILDRIVVRRPVPRNKRGLAYGKVTIKAGTDAYQIKKILKLVSGARKYGSLLIFDPTKYGKIATTASNLPALEVRIETLRAALESVVEAAQEKDGKRRAFHVDPATGGIVYGYADPSEVAYPTAPWRIVDRPEDESTGNGSGGSGSSAADFDALIRSHNPLVFYRGSEASGDLRSRPVSAGSADAPRDLAPYTGDGTYVKPPLYHRPGPFNGLVPDNYAVRGRFTGTSGTTPTGALTAIAFGRLWGIWRYVAPAPIGSDYVTHIAVDFTSGYGNTGTTAGVTIAGPSGYGHGGSLSTWAAAEPSGKGWIMAAGVYDPTTTPYFANGYLRVLAWRNGGKHAKTFPNTPLDSSYQTGGGNDYGAYVESVSGRPGPLPGIPDALDPDELGSVGPFAVFDKALTDAELQEIADTAFAGGLTAVMPRSLQMTVDHSRVVKSAIFLTADSAADADTEPDAYGRNYDTLKNSAGTGLAFAKRNGVKFMAAVEAPTVRSGDAAARSAKVNSLARAYFTTRRKPEAGLTLRIRGANDLPGERHGLSGGWRPADDKPHYVTGWRPGQFVSVTNKALGLEGLYRIESVTQTFEPGGFIRAFDIELERRPRNSVARLMIAQ